jgi:hypothetical protein
VECSYHRCVEPLGVTRSPPADIGVHEPWEGSSTRSKVRAMLAFSHFNFREKMSAPKPSVFQSRISCRLV